MSTPWAKRKLTGKRSNSNKQIVNSFFIYCEGENTEPEYFKSFPVNPQTTEVYAVGYARQKTALVNHVIEKLTGLEYLKGQKNYDSNRQLWVVFDYDYKGEKKEEGDFNDAIQKAESKGINVAVNGCFFATD